MAELAQKRLITSGASRVRELMDYHERKIQLAFMSFTRVSRSGEVFNRARDLLVEGNVEGAVDTINQQAVIIANTIVESLVESVKLGIEDLYAIAMLQNPGVKVNFDPTEPRLVKLMQDTRTKFIRDFNDTQRLATQEALSEISTAISVDETVSRFKLSIGLNVHQVRAVNNYRRLLNSNNIQLVDAAFIAKAERNERPLTDSQMKMMVSRYGERHLINRSSSIATLAASRAIHQGNNEALLQAIDQGGIDPYSVERVWNTLDDGKVRHAHYSMDGQVTGVDEPFVDGDGNMLMFPGDPSAPLNTTSRCRCTVFHRMRA